MTVNLSQHFSLDELAGSDTAVRLGIDNTPPADILPRLVGLALTLEKVRALLERPLIVRSGYRCEALERALCEKDFLAWCRKHNRDALGTAWREYFNAKAHPKGYAADIVCPAFGGPAEIARLIVRSGIAFDQLIEEGVTPRGGGWVHISIDPRMRGNVLTATFGPDGVPHYQLLPA